MVRSRYYWVGYRKAVLKNIIEIPQEHLSRNHRYGITLKECNLKDLLEGDLLTGIFLEIFSEFFFVTPVGNFC